MCPLTPTLHAVGVCTVAPHGGAAYGEVSTCEQRSGQMHLHKSNTAVDAMQTWFCQRHSAPLWQEACQVAQRRDNLTGMRLHGPPSRSPSGRCHATQAGCRLMRCCPRWLTSQCLPGKRACMLQCSSCPVSELVECVCKLMTVDAIYVELATPIAQVSCSHWAHVVGRG